GSEQDQQVESMSRTGALREAAPSDHRDEAGPGHEEGQREESKKAATGTLAHDAALGLHTSPGDAPRLSVRPPARSRCSLPRVGSLCSPGSRFASLEVADEPPCAPAFARKSSPMPGTETKMQVERGRAAQQSAPGERRDP